MQKKELVEKILNTLELIEIKGAKNIQLMYGLITGLYEELESESDQNVVKNKK